MKVVYIYKHMYVRIYVVIKEPWCLEAILCVYRSSHIGEAGTDEKLLHPQESSRSVNNGFTAAAVGHLLH